MSACASVLSQPRTTAGRHLGPHSMADRRENFYRLLAIWGGSVPLEELDRLVAPGYVGHVGSRDRSLTQLKTDIAAHRAASPAVFRAQHQISEGDYLATRLTAHLIGAVGSSSIHGMNISRWENELLLAEEWAVWESFGVVR